MSRRPAKAGVGSVASVGGVLDAAAQFVSYGNTNLSNITLAGSGQSFPAVSVPLGRELALAGNADEVLMFMAWDFPYLCIGTGSCQYVATINPPGGSGIAASVGPITIAAIFDTRTWPTMFSAGYVPRSRFTPGGNWTFGISKSGTATTNVDGIFAQGIFGVIG